MHYLKRSGIDVVGIDWSVQLKIASESFDSSVRYDVGDMRDMPYIDNNFGGVLALGSIEHIIEGPGKILSEIYRVMKPGGVAIITVPYMSTIRSVSLFIKHPLGKMKNMNVVRRVFGKQRIDNNKSASIIRRQCYRRGVRMDLTVVNGRIEFYQYQYRKNQFFEELSNAGFVVSSINANSLDEGIFHNFGSIAGRWDSDAGRVNFTIIGKLLRKMLNVEHTGHMLGAIVTKPT